MTAEHIDFVLIVTVGSVVLYLCCRVICVVHVDAVCRIIIKPVSQHVTKHDVA